VELENEEDKEISLFKRKRNERADVSGHILCFVSSYKFVSDIYSFAEVVVILCTGQGRNELGFCPVSCHSHCSPAFLVV
jgi:hypothetical protein